MYQLALKTLLLCTIPKAVEEAWDYMFGEPKEKPPVKVLKHARKSPDNTKITQEHYDWIFTAEKQANDWNLNNPHRNQRISKQDIANNFNIRFGTSKSRSAIRRIYTENKREDLPPYKSEQLQQEFNFEE